MAKPRQLTPSCFSGGTITFHLYPDPQQMTETVVERKPVYIAANGSETFEVTGTPFLVQKRDELNRRLFLTPEGVESINSTNDAGDVVYEPIMVQYEADDTVTRDVTWPDGTPRITFGSMNYNPPILCKQKDPSGNRVHYAGDPSNPIGFTHNDLTQEEVQALQQLFAGFLTRVAAQHELYPSPAAADAAGA